MASRSTTEKPNIEDKKEQDYVLKRVKQNVKVILCMHLQYIYTLYLHNNKRSLRMYHVLIVLCDQLLFLNVKLF